MNISKAAAVCVVVGCAFAAHARLSHAQASKSIAQVRWEYAFVTPDASRPYGPRDQYGQTKSKYGIEVLYPRQAAVFLAPPLTQKRDVFLHDILNRLGDKGWEIVSVPVYNGPRHYILKRRK